MVGIGIDGSIRVLILMLGDLRGVVNAVVLSRSVIHNIRQDLLGEFVYELGADPCGRWSPVSLLTECYSTLSWSLRRWASPASWWSAVSCGRANSYFL